MNIFKKITRVFARFRQKSISFLSSALSLSGFENFYDSLNLASFKDSLYLFIGVSMIRETVSSIELEMYQIKNLDGEVEEIYDDPVLSLIKRPNTRQTQKEFWKLAIAYYLLAGETFWYLERPGENSIPTSLVNLRPDYVQIIFNIDRTEIVAYEYHQINGEILKLPPQDVLHIKNIDPTNPARGIGVVRPATSRIITEQEASKYQANAFKTQGKPDIAVMTEADPLTEEDSEQARENWRKIYGNPEHSSAGFFGAKVKDIKVLGGVAPKEMDYINSQNFLRDDILAALHIPKAMITSDDVNLANAKVARVVYIKEAVEPVLDTFLDIINNKFLTDVDEDKFFAYETEATEDRELLLKESVELKKAAIITVNESRSLLNYPDLPDGDVREQSSSGLGGFGSQQNLSFRQAIKHQRLQKKAKALLRSRVVLQRKFKTVTAVTKMIEAEKRLKGITRGKSPVFYTEEMKQAYIKVFNDNIDKKAKAFHETVDVYNNGLLQRILKHQSDFGLNPKNVFDAVIEIREAKAAFTPMMKSMYKKMGQETMATIANGFAQKATEQFYTTDAVLQQLEHRAEFFILSMLDTDFKQLSDIIATGITDGKGVEEIGRDLRQYFDDMSVARAKTIARTETGRIVSQATNDAYNQSEVVTGKEWLTAGDDRVRDEHVINNGVVVATGDTFPDGEAYPGELSINCRCALAPAV